MKEKENLTKAIEESLKKLDKEKFIIVEDFIKELLTKKEKRSKP